VQSSGVCTASIPPWIRYGRLASPQNWCIDSFVIIASSQNTRNGGPTEELTGGNAGPGVMLRSERLELFRYLRDSGEFHRTASARLRIQFATPVPRYPKQDPTDRLSSWMNLVFQDPKSRKFSIQTNFSNNKLLNLDGAIMVPTSNRLKTPGIRACLKNLRLHQAATTCCDALCIGQTPSLLPMTLIIAN
jgi:hypothetical protein